MPRTSRRRLLTPALGLALLAPAAPLAAQAGGDAPTPTPPPTPPTVAFVNESLDLARVYLVGPGGHQYRVGTVMPGRTERLRLPSALVAAGAPVELVVRPLASWRQARSGPLAMHDGATWTVRLPMMQNTLDVLPGVR